MVIKLVVVNNKTKLEKNINIANFSNQQLNEILYFYNHRTEGRYHAYTFTEDN